MTTGANQGGFEDRFRVTRVDRQPIKPERRYIVLAYDGSDPHAQVALEAYADSIQAENPNMAEDLRDALRCPQAYPAQHD